MFRLITLTALLAIVATISANKPLHHPLAQERTSVQPKAEGDYRLPGTTIPISYDLSLTTNIHKGEFDFTGKVIISLKVVTATTEIVLHSKLSNIVKIELKNALDVVISQTHSFDTVKDFLTITLQTPTVVDEILTLDIDYTSVLRDDNAGFYRSSYTTSANVVRWLATTQFESTDARHALPCYDEPHLKAFFKVKITHGEEYHAISNMNIVNETAPVGGMKTTTFAETQPMSSYLLAFIVSDFAFVEDTTANPIQRVYAQPELVSKLDFSLKAGVDILKAFEDYFEVPYGLTKLDQAAIPDFAAGAMENWGMVTYREEYLTYDPAVSSDRQKELIATIVAHEYAHQWFGDLVSPEWWQYIWLNEGFATYYENFMADIVYPEMKLMDTYVTSVVQYSFGPDALDTTRIMSHDAQTPSEISGLFDNIAYDKSGCVIRMMHHALTEPVYKAGINKYLVARSLKEANEEHLFQYLNEAALEDGKAPSDMSTIFGSWSKQKGYPLLTVTRDYTTGAINLTQERFLLKPVEGDNLTWWLPLNFMSKTKKDAVDTAPMLWMENVKEIVVKPNETTFGAINNDDWVIFNKQQTGYYRVQYDMDNWHLLMTALETDRASINAINRAQIIDDSFNLARAGIEDYHVPFMLIKYLKQETDYLPWAAASNSFGYLNRMFIRSTQYDQLQKLLLELVESLYNNIGIDEKTSDTHLDKYTRNIAINWACSLGNADCLDKTKAAVTEAVNSNTAIKGNLRSVMYCNGLRSASEEIFMKMQEKLVETKDQNERTIIINALGCSQNATLLENYLASALETDSPYRRQEKSRVISAVYNSGPAGVDATITFMKAKAEDIVNILNSRTLNSYLTTIASRVVTDEQIAAFEDLINDETVKGFLTENTSKNCAELISDTKKWFEDNKNSIEGYLSSVYGSASTVFVSVVAFITTFFITFNNLY